MAIPTIDDTAKEMACSSSLCRTRKPRAPVLRVVTAPNVPNLSCIGLVAISDIGSGSRRHYQPIGVSDSESIKQIANYFVGQCWKGVLEHTVG